MEVGLALGLLRSALRSAFRLIKSDLGAVVERYLVLEARSHLGIGALLAGLDSLLTRGLTAAESLSLLSDPVLRIVGRGTETRLGHRNGSVLCPRPGLSRLRARLVTARCGPTDCLGVRQSLRNAWRQLAASTRCIEGILGALRVANELFEFENVRLNRIVGCSVDVEVKLVEGVKHVQLSHRVVVALFGL